MKYTLEYLFGMKCKSGKKAVLGTIFHRCFELRGLAGMAKKAGKSSFVDSDLGELSVKRILNNEKNLDLCFDYYTKIEAHHKYTNSDKKTIANWIEATLRDYPQYDPVKLDIIATEQYFDIEIPDDWARFEGVVDGQEVSGQLSIKGTMDKIVRITDEVYELVDYKTGQRREDFATGEEKDLAYFENDVQLLLYLIAMRHIWPDKELLLTLFYINKGGMFTVHGDDAMYDRAIQMLKDSFKKIGLTNRPKQLDPYHKDWRCKYCCDFSKPHQNGGQSICQFYKGEIERNGLQPLQDKLIDIGKLLNYQDGGGRKAE